MNVQPGIHPRERPRTTGSHAEVRLYESLKSGLPEGWYAWHSLRLMEGNGVFGEGDFVIADPNRGLLAVEVKGGNIEQRDGRWFQNGVPMASDPRAQGNEFVRKLISRLSQEGCSPPAFGIGTCFPDVFFDVAPSEDDLSRTTIGKQDLAWIGERLKSLMNQALPRPRRAKGRWIEHLQKIWGETWIPSLSLGNRARAAESEWAKLDEHQIRTLNMLERASHLLVEGGAGSGKTLIAREAARRFADKGMNVLLICFTNALAAWLQKSLNSPKIQVWALGKLALEYARTSGVGSTEPKDKEGWDRVVLSITADALPKIKRDWDAVILDEAQDLSDVDWMFALELARDKRLWVFHDPAQHFWTDRQLPADVLKFTPIQLQDAHRCPAGIMAFADCYRDTSRIESSKDIVGRAIADETIGIVVCPSATSIADKIANEIGKLRSAGFKPQDIAIVSVRGQQAAGTFALERIGAYRLVKADDPAAEHEIVDDTFLRFKGLERPAIIVTDLNLTREPRNVRMYISVTRALTAVRIMATRESIAADPVLRELAATEVSH